MSPTPHQHITGLCKTGNIHTPTFGDIDPHPLTSVWPLPYLTLREVRILYRDVLMGAWGGIVPPNIFKFARKLVKSQPFSHAARELATVVFKFARKLVKSQPFSHAARELATVFSVKNAPPPKGRCLSTSLILSNNSVKRGKIMPFFPLGVFPLVPQPLSVCSMWER